MCLFLAIASIADAFSPALMMLAPARRGSFLASHATANPGGSGSTLLLLGAPKPRAAARASATR